MCKYHYWLDYRIRHKKRVRELQKEWRERSGFKSVGAMHKMRYGGMREFIMTRDGYKCVICGMTDEEHRVIWNCGLTINHEDHTGRTNKPTIPNNDPDNLEVLCLPCHGAKDATKHGRYARYFANLGRERGVITL